MDQIFKRIDEEIEYSKSCGVPQFTLGMQHVKKIISLEKEKQNKDIEKPNKNSRIITKYELEKCLLTNSIVIADIGLTVSDEDSEEDKTFKDEYDKKISLAKLAMLNHIQNKEILTGIEVVGYIKKIDLIIDNLQEQAEYAELLFLNKRSFLETLQDLMAVTMERITAHEEATKLLTGKRSVLVIVDGNNNHLPKQVKTEIMDNDVTIEKCRQITEKIRMMGHEPKIIEFLLSIYTETPDNECGDFAEECVLNKTAIYYPEHDDLIVEEETPTY